MRSALILTISLSILVGVALPGCKYDRLLAAKEQFRTLESHVRISHLGSCRIEFIRPVLLASDIEWLGFHPSRAEQRGDVNRWYYDFRRSGAKTEVAPITVEAVFRGERLREIVIPETLASMLPEQLPAAFLRALGHAKVSFTKPQLRFDDFENARIPLMQLPHYSAIQNALGAPSERRKLDPPHFAAIYNYTAQAGRKKLNFHLYAVFREHFNTMKSGGIVFGPYRIDFSEAFIAIEAI